MRDDLRSSVLVDALERRVIRYCEITGEKPSTVSKRAVGNSTWLKSVLEGSGFQTRIYDRFQAWLDAHWPSGKRRSRLREVEGDADPVEPGDRYQKK